MLRAPALLIALVALPVPAMAMTGAELLTAERRFASGFTWGALEAATVAVAEEETQRTAWQQCIARSSVTNTPFYEAVVSYVRRTPKALDAPASYSVLSVLKEMCE